MVAGPPSLAAALHSRGEGQLADSEVTHSAVERSIVAVRFMVETHFTVRLATGASTEEVATEGVDKRT